VNVLKPHLRTTIETLLAHGASHREIERRTGVDRKTIRRYARRANATASATGSTNAHGSDSSTPATGSAELCAAKSPTPATGSEPQASATPSLWTAGPERAALETATLPTTGPVGTQRAAVSACEPHREWIEAQVRLGRNAVSIYQELVEQHAFTHRYNSVKRFVAKLRAREPERFDVLEFPPGEEGQVDFGLGAPTEKKEGLFRRPFLFVMTLKYSGKSFRKTVWKADQETWARLHEDAFHAFGGCPRYVVLDNLKAGVLRPDLYEPELNPLYDALLRHYSVVADPCRVQDPNRKGTVENAIQHTQGTALQGKRFDSIEEQNAWLAHWEERWAALRIHGRKKRQVLEMFQEEKSHLLPLPTERFRYFRQAKRTVDDGGLVQVDGSYYAALPAPLYSEVTVRIYDREIEVLGADGECVRRHEKSLRKGSFTMESGDRLFNPSRESVRLLSKAQRIGPSTAAYAQELFARLGRPGHRALYGLTNLARTYPRIAIEEICGRLLAADCFSYSAVKRTLERTQSEAARAAGPALIQSGPVIRDVTEYQEFWDSHSFMHIQEEGHAHVDP
jgi:transposase